MQLHNRFGILLAIVASGCAGQVRLDPVVVQRPPVSIPTPTPLSLNPVTWKVLNQDDIKALARQSANNPIFALDEQNYQSWSLNLIEIKRYLEEQKAVIKMTTGLLNPTPAPAKAPAP